MGTERVHGIEIVVDAPRRTLNPQEYMKVLVETRLALEEVDKLALPGASRLDWVIDDVSVNGVHRAVFVPRSIPRKRTVSTVTATTLGLVNGITLLRQRAEIPPLFSATTVGRVAAIGKPVGERAAAVHIRSTDDKESATVDQTTIEHAKQATHTARQAFGSVEGRLDVLDRRRGRVGALVVDDRTRRAVAVRAADDDAERLRQAWGERVRIAGVLVRNQAGQPIRLDMTEMRVVPERQEVSPWDILGVAPDFTGDLTTEEFIRHARRG